MLDTKDKQLDNQDLQELVDSASGDHPEQDKLSKDARFLKCEKICKNSIRHVGRAQSLWFLIAIFAILGAGLVLFFQKKGEFYKISEWKFEEWAASVVALIMVLLACSRISSNSAHLKHFKDKKKYLLGDLPMESDLFIREVYFFYCKRKCTHFWLSVGFGALFMLCILYPILACGVDMIANWKWKPTHVKLFSSETLSPGSWGIEHKFCAMGIVGVFLTLTQYFLCRDGYRKAADAFEERFGQEKIVDECLYCSRMCKVNFRYKSFAFIIVCLCGCFFYLLTKRLICVIFDKSFTF